MKKTFYIYHTGCDSLEFDSESISWQLQSEFDLLPSTIEKADLIVLLGCTFTQQKEDEFKGNIESILRNIKPELLIVSGCYLLDYIINEKVVFAKKNVIVDIVKKHLKINDRNLPRKTVSNNSKSPIIAVSEGCYGNCSFCSVKTVRGRHRSRDISNILSDVENALSSHDTVRFVGQDVAAYGRDNSLTFGHLLRAVIQRFPSIRLELGSLNPQWLIRTDMKDLSLLSSHNIVGNIHVPLQSASEYILERMDREYTYSEYESLWAKLTEIGIEDLSTDIIAGFPGEVDKDHRCTLRFLRNHKLAFVQIFMFESRPGTLAASYDQLSREIRLKRTLDLIAEYIASYLRFRGITKKELDIDFSAPFNSNIKINKEKVSNESRTVFS